MGETLQTPVQTEVAVREVLERARVVVEDHSLAGVKAWKQANPDGLVIGAMPVYLPRPLFEAIGCLPVGVFGGGDEIEIIRGDSYFQSYICHIPRSTLELGLGGQLDVLDGMVFPSLCDVIRNLGGMWKILFPQKWMGYLDLPQNFAPTLGAAFYATELRRMARELHERGARPLDPDALREALRTENTRRESLSRLDALRRRAPWLAPASEAYLVARAGTRLPAAEHTQLVNAYIAAAEARPPKPLDNVRVVVVGAFCEQPPLDLIRTLEKAGCDIVDDDLQLGLRYLEAPIDVGALDPITALARAFTVNGSATASRYIDQAEKGAALLRKVREAEADGVVFAAASFCDPALLDQPMIEAALDRAGVPHTSFKFSENIAQFQVIREQAGAFSDSVKLWEAAV
ncbi:MAG: benzoyl-CoA reductase subunit C [Myxococcota bacterium]